MVLFHKQQFDRSPEHSYSAAEIETVENSAQAIPAAVETEYHPEIPVEVDQAEDLPEEKPSPVDPQSELFPEADILAVRIDQASESNQLIRTSLLKTDFKYPLLLSKEILQTNAVGETNRVSRQVMVADHIIVRFQAGTDAGQVVQLAEEHGGSVLKTMLLPDTYLIRFEDVDLDTVSKKIAAFQQLPDVVKYAEADFIVSSQEIFPDDPDFSEQWGLHNTGQDDGTVDADIDAPGAWELATGSRDILVAVIDSGVDYNHEDLADNMWINSGEELNGFDDDGNGLVDDIHGWDFCNNDNDPMDDAGHGTHCCGIIGAVGSNSVGVAGVCWNVSMVGLKFLNSSGHGATSDGIDATVYAAQIGARLISASYGGSSYNEAYEDALALAASSNMLFIAAAGNTADDNDAEPHYPSSYTNDHIIAVANSTRTDELSVFSCYGLTSVDLAAPGSSILSTLPNNEYGVKSGTSMATPCVSGSAALLWAYHPELTASEVKEALLNTVDTNAAFMGKTVSGGRLNLNRAVRFLDRLYFDQTDYFTGEWMGVTLIDRLSEGAASRTVEVSTDSGDSQTLVLSAVQSGGRVFSNRLWLAQNEIVTAGNGQIEASHGTVVTAVYSNEESGIVRHAETSVNLALQIQITTSNQIVSYGAGSVQIVGENNGNVNVAMTVSNAANGDVLIFTAENDWQTPYVYLEPGLNEIWVKGENTHGFSDEKSVLIYRRETEDSAAYVSQDGLSQWPYATWQTAATNIQTAIDTVLPGETVWVSNGVYNLQSEISVSTNIAVRSLNGPEMTRIDGLKECRGFNLSGNSCSISGFTIRNGYDSSKGGGIYCTNFLPIVSNCVLSGCYAQMGGGIYYGKAVNCKLTDNRANYGAGAYRTIVRNSYVNGNHAEYNGGGTYYCTNYNVTVTGNSAVWMGGGTYSGKSYNSIIYDNTANLYSDWRYGTFYYCCASGSPGGSGNITDHPALTDSLHLSVSSPCIGAGSAAYAEGRDIEGTAWKSPPSMGCHEYSGTFGGSLAVSVLAEHTNICVNTPVCLSGTVSGSANSTEWNFGDGLKDDNRQNPVHQWGSPGLYDVVLSAVNNDGTVSATVQVSVVSASVHYVNISSTNPQSPYTSWEHAAHTIQNAVDAAPAGATVFVADGIYSAGGRTSVDGICTNRVCIDKPLTVQSINGSETAWIVGKGPIGPQAVRGVWLAKHARIEGFSVSNGCTASSGNIYSEQSGGGVWCAGEEATVVNCVIQNCSADNYGGGMASGTALNSMLTSNETEFYGGGSAYTTLSNCCLTGNHADSSGGGFYDGTLYQCVVSSNISIYNGGGGYNGTLYNCLVTGNSSGGKGGGSYSGTLYNCTVNQNTAGDLGGETSYGSLRNTIVWPADIYSSSQYGCWTNDPLFADSHVGDFHLQSTSPCIDAGMAVYVKTETDLDGQARIVGNAVDIGAYEFGMIGDVDEDGLPDDWESRYFGNSKSADPNKLAANGLNSLRAAYIAGLDPTDPQNVFGITGGDAETGTFEWSSVSGRVYSVWWTTNLTESFQCLESNILWTAGS
ncbi:MAG: S8 family serine peptidase, partial [Kiritimatiellales bacterium]